MKAHAKNNNGWKTFVRGHKYRSTACPICWKGNTRKKGNAPRK